MMDVKSQEIMDSILVKHESELTDFDKGFLRARSVYVPTEFHKKYPSVFSDMPVVAPKAEAPVVPEVTEAQAVVPQVNPVVTGDDHSADPDWQPQQ